MTLTDEQWQEYLQAEERARKVLRPGDRIVFTSCPGTKRHGVFQGWYGRTICIRTRDDISPRSISKVNGYPVDFTKPAEEEGCLCPGLNRGNFY